MAGITKEQLEQAVLFGKVDDQVREAVAPYFELCTFSNGEILFEQGSPREYIQVIFSGEIELIDSSQGQEKVFITTGPGTVLGESILFKPETSFSLGARAISDGTFARLSPESIETIREKHPQAFIELLIETERLLTRRMANASRSERGRGSNFRADKTRIEHDMLGEMEIPENAYWGVQTLRAVENFSISNIRIDHFPEWIEALALIKRSCILVNHRLGYIDQERTDAVVQACDELIKGWWHGHFIVDAIQGGAGTSTNMNANEVITNRALQILERKKGDYAFLHPNTHVNMSQSTNDVYPSSIKIATLIMMQGFAHEVEELAASFDRKGDEFADVIKMGRTQLQDAVPMTLGQEFKAWARNIREGGQRIELAIDGLRFLNMGGTAIGTGINTDPRYARMVIDELNNSDELQGFNLDLAPDLVEETQDTSGFVELAGVFKMFAIRLSKICNDLRLLSSGPRCGFNEINLPAVQPGSSIMPGKVNPVIPEVVNQVAFQIIGLDTTVSLASEAGQLELNVFEPIIAFNLFTSIRMLLRAMPTLRLRCIDGITANKQRCLDLVKNSIGIVTALNPLLGYEKTSNVAKEALKTGRSVYDLVLEKGLLDQETLDRLLSPASMLQPTLHKGEL